MTLLLLIETLFCIVQARSVQLMYIDNRNYPGGPWQYFLDTQNLPINVMFYATLFVLTFLADLLVVSCCFFFIKTSILMCFLSYGGVGLSTALPGEQLPV